MKFLKIIFWVAAGFIALFVVIMVFMRIPGEDGLSADDKEIIKGQLSVRFRDPASVQVTKLWVSTATYSMLTICGLVNGKNAYGAYVGAQTYTGLYDRGAKRFRSIYIADGEREGLRMLDKCVTDTIAFDLENKKN